MPVFVNPRLVDRHKSRLSGRELPAKGLDGGCKSVQNECLSGPWPDAGNPVDGDVSDVAGLSGFRRWELDIRTEISVSQTLQQGRGASFGDVRPPVNDEIFN